MVTVFLRGGLGNQMFQYALGISLAKKNNTELAVDTTFLNDRFPRRQFTYRNFDLDMFGVTPRRVGFSNLSERFPLPGVWLGLDLALVGVRDMFGIQALIRERQGYVFDAQVLNAPQDSVLWGFWNSPKYFEEAADEVRRAFQFQHSLKGEALEIKERIEKTQSVSIHVRRGDYVAYANMKAIVGGTNLGYYAAAVQHIAERIRDPHFFIFSDDIEWCKKNVMLPFPTTYMSNSSSGPKMSYHLELMSRCKHNIITNSTFSWWGAWLNTHPEKIVVAPTYWQIGLQHDDVIPEAWIRM